MHAAAVWRSALCAAGLWVAACSAPVPVQISASAKGAYEVSLATLPHGLAAAWHDLRDGNAEIYLRMLDADGRPQGAELRLTNTPDASYEASLDRIDDEFVLAWYEQTPSGQQTVMLGAWNDQGDRLWLQTFPSGTRNPVMHVAGDRIFCAWIQAGAGGMEDVLAGWWSRDGEPQGAPVTLGPASKNTWNLNAAIDGVDAWVVFDSVNGTRTSELHLAHVDRAGAALTQLTRDDGWESKYPDLAIDDTGRAALTWYDAKDGNAEVYLLVTTVKELGRDVEARARRVTVTPGESIGAYIAWTAGRVGLAWSDKHSSQHDVYFQSFEAAGAPLADAVRVTRNSTWSLVPAIRPWRAGFALAWNEYQPASAVAHDGTSEAFVALVP